MTPIKKKVKRGLVTGLSGASVSAILFWQLQTVSSRLDKISDSFGTVEQQVAALRYAVFGVALDTTLGKPPLVFTSHKPTVWARPGFFIPTLTEKEKK